MALWLAAAACAADEAPLPSVGAPSAEPPVLEPSEPPEAEAAPSPESPSRPPPGPESPEAAPSAEPLAPEPSPEPPEAAPSPESSLRRPLVLEPVLPGDLWVTSGSISVDADVVAPKTALGALPFSIRSPTLRAWLGRAPRSAVELEFLYRGASAADAPLASGELRRQIGVELRARDTCNVVYVMWRIEPVHGIVVSVKSNPGQSLHSECGANGYVAVQPWESRPVAQLRAGEWHVLRATLAGEELEILVDGVRNWRGLLPPAALAVDGPVGLRSDNGQFDVLLRAQRLFGNEEASSAPR